MIDLAVVKAFDEACVAVAAVDPELRQHAVELVEFAKAHERRHLVLHNLCHQLKVFDRFMHRAARASLERRQKDKQLLITSVAQMFLKAIKVKRDQDNWSTMRRIQETHRDSTHKAVAQLIREVPRDDQGNNSGA